MSSTWSRWSVSLWLLFLGLTPVFGQATQRQQHVATVGFVQGLQAADGGFLPAAPKPGAQGESNLRATSSALRALKYFGGEAKDKAACIRFVESCYDKASGGFAPRPGGMPDVITTAIGVMALRELGRPTQPFEAAVLKFLGSRANDLEEIRMAAAGTESLGKQPPETKAWLDRVMAARNPDGTFGTGDGIARATGGMSVVILRLGGDLDQRAVVLRALRDGQRADGGFGKEGVKPSDLESTYRIMRAFMMLKELPARPEQVRAFVGSCRNADGGYGLSPGQLSTVSATYFAGIVLHWLDAK